MKALRVILLFVCCIHPSCEKQRSPSGGSEAPLSKVQAEQLAVEALEAGGEARYGAVGDAWWFCVDDTPERCLRISNKIPAIDTFYIGGSDIELSVKQLELLKARDETREFRILYGSVAPDTFTELPKKFPHLRELVLWSPNGSDISRLGDFLHLTIFTSDFDNLITVEEARRLRHQGTLASVSIDRGESKEVFDILKELPLIEELSVSVALENGEWVYYEL